MREKFLENILAYKKELNEKKRSFYSSLRDSIDKATYERYRLFKQCISTPNKLNLIAEIKKASPSKGVIRPDFDINDIAKVYKENGVDAVSVLTEDKFFLGKPEYIQRISDIAKVPLLAKDFIVDDGQIYEARFYGASAVLLIAACLEDKEMKRFIEIAEGLDLDCLVEVHNEDELNRVLDCGAQIIGVNNRDLRTFEVDINVCLELAPKIPKGKVIVAESGIRTHQDVVKLIGAGVNAVLIGEAFMRSKDIGFKIKEIMEGKIE